MLGRGDYYVSAGAVVSPKELNSFITEGVSAWSVRFDSEGEHKGIVSVSESPPNTRFIGNPTLSILAYSPVFSLRNIFSAIAVILGPLISIPGMYAFFREIRRERSKEKKESTRIIVP